jgi:hypothetical protein
MADGSCDYAEQGYDCDGNINVHVGAEAFGGIVFYVDETGQHGLVAAMDDLTEGATDPYGYGYNGYEWGCYGETVSGAEIVLGVCCIEEEASLYGVGIFSFERI